MERNCILKVLPPDIVEDALEEVRKTIVRASRTDGAGKEVDRGTALRRIAAAFGEYGVTSEMIDRYLGHTVLSITGEEIADLHAVLTSIRDGNSRADELFDMASPTANQRAAAAAVAPLDALTARLTTEAAPATPVAVQEPARPDVAWVPPTEAEFQETLRQEAAAAPPVTGKPGRAK